MASKSDELKERYEWFTKGDLERALDLWTDDFVWDGGPSGLPGSGRHEGRAAATAVVVEGVGAYDSFVLSAEEFFEQGDTVVVLGHQDIAKADRSTSLPFVHVWRHRGSQIHRVQIMFDTVETARILGLA